MSMSLHGNIREFRAGENITDYLDRLQFYFIANDITNEDKRRAILLTVIGPEQYSLLKDLSFPVKPAEKSYTELTTHLIDYHAPKPSKFLQRSKFDARNRNDGESIQSFHAALRHLSQDCEFGPTLDERLCEKFVTGLNNREIQKKLLIEKDLTFGKAYSIAVAHTETLECATAITNTTNSSVSYVKTNTPSSTNNHRRSNFAHNSSKNVRTNQLVSTKCYRCNGPHSHMQCKFINATCFHCNKQGHIAKVCKSRLRQNVNNRPTNNNNNNRTRSHNHFNLTTDTTFADSNTPPESNESSLFNIHGNNTSYSVCLKINGRPISLQVDTGSSLTVITINDYNRLIGIPLNKTSHKLHTYTGQSVRVVGETDVQVNYNGSTHHLPLVVVEGTGPPLLGRNWLSTIRLDWNNIFNMQNPTSRLQVLLKRYENAFGTNGLLRDHKVKIQMKENASAKFCKARQPPFALREGIEEELQRLENAGIISKVKYSNWATPIVPVRKHDGSIRICGDYKQTVNKCVEMDRHPIPRVEELTTKLGGGEKYSRIDFSGAFNQLMLDEDSKKYTTINTHKGLYQYNRLCFGISSCPSIFQRTMEMLFSDVKNVAVYFDDLFITGRDDEEHLQTIETVLRIVESNGMSINRNKCEFLQEEITFLGYRLSKSGLRPSPDKVDAIKNAQKPKTVQELKAFLGMINYYSKFVHNLSNVLSPLYKLLNKNVSWHWGGEQERAFKSAIKALSSDQVLVHFDSTQPVVLTCDAAPNGVAGILSHTDGINEHPIAYASRSLNAAEKNYSQIDREALSIIFSVRKFHQYVYGRHITIYTDHKPLLGLLGEHKTIPDNVSARMQRWAIVLAGYDYTLKYKPGKHNNADALSRLPLRDQTEIFTPPEIDSLFNFIDQLPISVEKIKEETKKDPVLVTVKKCILHGGWANNENDSIKPFKSRQFELSIENECLLWGTRVIIPYSLKTEVLNLLHDTHVGTAKMKALARSFVWWNNIDSDIEQHVKLCYTCQLHAKTPAKAPLHPWEWPDNPWERIHVDFAGPFMGKMFLIIMDAHSKWMEVKIMTKITTSQTIMELRDVFSTMGLPKIIVSDNGPTFTSTEFSNFMVANGVKHITVSPYHPSSNGLAERAVQTFKQAMVKIRHGDVREKCYRFLTKYRNTPHSTTGVCPAELVFGRKIRTHLDLLHPNLQTHVHDKQRAQKQNYDKRAVDRDIGIEDTVFVRNYDRNTRSDKWVPGTVVQQTGPVSFKVHTPSHGLIRRHQDQIRVTHSDLNPEHIVPLPAQETQTELDRSRAVGTEPHHPNGGEVQTEFDHNVNSGAIVTEAHCHKENGASVLKQPSEGKEGNSDKEGIGINNKGVVELRRSTRQSKPPDRYTP